MNFSLENKIIQTPDLNFDENCGGFGVLLFKKIKKYSNLIALHNTRTNERLTYGQLFERCTQTATILQKKGLKRGDIIAVCSDRENFDANVPIIAGQFLGLITFCLDPCLTIEECTELLIQVQPSIIFCINQSKELMQSSLTKLKINAEMIIFGKDFDKDFLVPQDNNVNFEPVHVENLKDTCLIHFSSGSTSKPKAICLNHYFLLASDIRNYEIHEKINSNEWTRPTSLRYANWYWISATLEMVGIISLGGCRLLRNSFDAQEFCKYIEEYRVTDSCITPLNCIDITRIKLSRKYDFSSLKLLVTGGYVLREEYIKQLRWIFKDTLVYQIYGMTECGMVTKYNRTNTEDVKMALRKPSSCGLPVEGYFYKVIDIETGKKCGFHESGELYLKGKMMFNGCYNKDVSSSFDEDGYFRTGDIVYFDEDFCFYILDRLKSILGWNDWLIYPYYIEKVLQEHPAVSDAVVIGIPHKIEGERLMGVVIRKNDIHVTEKELVEYVDARVRDHERLREGVIFIKEFPMTITEKLHRPKIKHIAIEEKKKNT